VHFHGYRIDTVHRTVTTPAGRMVRLEPKAFDLLLYFSEHPGETLSRERLIADVWGGKFVTDDAVMVAVYALRQAFDDDARSPKFIETIRGRGYRWIPVAAAPRTPLRPGPTLLIAVIIAIGFSALLWSSLREPSMPSIARTTELVRAHARGTFFSERTSRADLEEARSEFRKAIAIDSRFAEPHAALAQVDVRLVEIGVTDAEDEARREAAAAVELAPRFALSRAALASVQFVLDRDFEQAERSFRYAIELDPALPGIRRRYSYLLGASGRFAEAMQQARTAADLDPTSAGTLGDLAWAHMLAGRLADAERLYREAVRVEPGNGAALISLGYCLELRDAPDDAMQVYRRAMRIGGVPEDVIGMYDRAFSSAGMRGVYDAYLERMKSNRALPRFMLAFYAVLAGRTAEAMQLLEEAARRHEAATLWLRVHPAFAGLRDQREFTTLVASSFHTR
jgi:Tfp pilus assembly protein PilF